MRNSGLVYSLVKLSLLDRTCPAFLSLRIFDLLTYLPPRKTYTGRSRVSESIIDKLHIIHTVICQTLSHPSQPQQDSGQLCSTTIAPLLCLSPSYWPSCDVKRSSATQPMRPLRQHWTPPSISSLLTSACPT